MSRTPGAALALALLALGDCSNRGSTAPTRRCRQWPLQYSTSYGRTFKCNADPLNPSCSAFPIHDTFTWTYQTRSEFVHEADVPNRILALRRSREGCGTFVTTGCSHSLVAFTHDGQGRLVRRERSWSHSFGGSGTTDVVTYTAWDRWDRPTQGEIQTGLTTAPLTVVYDDARRIALASNGELTEQDAFGNVIREVVADSTSGTEYTIEYTIEALQEVCDEGA